ncbi:MAG: SGNH/GDSL hydrolase family protein [Acidobacteria bacterium]|nr:SGNH/GDSL hydrolase family protein [Acidobacteriota bacterium]
MKSLRVNSWKVIGLSVLFLALPGLAIAQTAYNGIVVFGTSLSDPGNVFALTGEQSTPPYDTLDPLIIPSAPYAKGGHHFSNGATWVEQLARSLGLTAYANPAFKGGSPKASNYAIGGARARTVAGSASLSSEVNAFLQDFGNAAPSDALYVIEFGGNDIRDALANGDPTILNIALSAIGSNIQTLYNAGARNFFVWNAPNLKLTPAVQMLGPIAGMYAEMFSQGFNAGLGSVLSGLSSLPDITIMSFDAYGILNGLVSDPEAFGLSVVDAACVKPNDPPFECKAPDGFLFWDGIHPTKAVHAILAQNAALVLAQQ